MARLQPVGLWLLATGSACALRATTPPAAEHATACTDARTPACCLLPSAFLTLGGTAISVFSALRDAAVSDTGTDWWALGAAFGTGALLGALACPVYRVELVPASTNDSSSSSSGVGSGSEAPPPDLLLPVVRDTRPPAARANAVVGCAAALFAALGVWLVQQGAFVG